MKKYSLIVIFGLVVIGFYGCDFGTDQPPFQPPTADTTVHTHSQAKFAYNYYIDNSGSMNGFTPTEKPTQFQKCVADFIQEIYDPATATDSFFTFNDKIYFISAANNPKDVTDFTGNLILNKIKKGSTGSTIFDYNTIFKTQTKNNITILISDFEPSENNSKKVLLSGEIKGLIGQKLEEFPFSTLFLKFHSDWGKSNKPYFIMLMGNESKINDILLFLERNNFSQKGLDEFYVLSNPEKHLAAEMNFSTDCYDLDLDNHGATAFEIKKSRCDDHNIFKCSFKIRMDSLPFSGNYLLDPNSYKAPDGFKIDVKTLTNDPKGYTHNITLTTSQFKKADIEFSIKNKLPPSLLSTPDKNDIPTLIQAAREAYEQHYPKMGTNQNESNYYFIKTIKLL